MSAYNGSGTFVITGTGLPFVTGTTISSTVANQLNSDLATGLSTAITKDGQTTPTANIPLGNFKLTGLGAPTTAGDALSYGGTLGTPSAGVLTNCTGLPFTGLTNYSVTTWTPSDASGAGLVFAIAVGGYTRLSNIYICYGKIQYPVTASGAANFLGGLPATVANQDYAQGGGVLTYCNETTAAYVMTTKNSTGFAIYDASGVALANATLSGKTLWVCITFPIT